MQEEALSTETSRWQERMANQVEKLKETKEKQRILVEEKDAELTALKEAHNTVFDCLRTCGLASRTMIRIAFKCLILPPPLPPPPSSTSARA
jgi:hypothetical protein